MNEQCKGANAELHVLQSEASLMFKRLAAASKLIDGEDVHRVVVMGDRREGGMEGQSINRDREKEGREVYLKQGL